MFPIEQLPIIDHFMGCLETGARVLLSTSLSSLYARRRWRVVKARRVLPREKRHVLSGYTSSCRSKLDCADKGVIPHPVYTFSCVSNRSTMPA